MWNLRAHIAVRAVYVVIWGKVFKAARTGYRAYKACKYARKARSYVKKGKGKVLHGRNQDPYRERLQGDRDDKAG